jgi:hypothetical protein
MEEANRIMCEKCKGINYVNAEFCTRCGKPQPHNAAMPQPEQSDTSSYFASPELSEPPRNALDELMHLGFGGLFEFGIRFGFVLAIAEIIALAVLVIIFIVFAVVLLLLGFGIGNLFFGNLTSLTGV